MRIIILYWKISLKMNARISNLKFNNIVIQLNRSKHINNNNSISIITITI